jgi:hypothetical protein
MTARGTTNSKEAHGHVHDFDAHDVGDAEDCRINGKPGRLTWRDEGTLVIEREREEHLRGQRRPHHSEETMIRHKHKTVRVVCPHMRHDNGKPMAIPIDVKLAPLLKAMWALGLETTASCQEAQPGMARLNFCHIWDVEHFLTIAGRRFHVHLDYAYEDATPDYDEPYVQVWLSVFFPTKEIASLVPRFERELELVREADAEFQAKAKAAGKKKAKPAGNS